MERSAIENIPVVVLAGGEGQRLRPYTWVVPKPLLPIGNTSVLELLLVQLQRQGFAQVILAVSYLAELVEAGCGDGSRFGLQIRYSREPTPLSTAGPLKLIDGLSSTFLTVNGDVLTDFRYEPLLRFHKERGAVATIAAQRRRIEIDFGVIEKRGNERLGRYIEKPSYDYLVSMGLNVLEPRVLDYIEPGEKLDMPVLMQRLGDAGERVLVFETECLWLDIGREDDYERAIDLFSQRSDFLTDLDAAPLRRVPRRARGTGS